MIRILLFLVCLFSWGISSNCSKAAARTVEQATTIDHWGVTMAFPEVRGRKVADWIVDRSTGGAGHYVMKVMAWLNGGMPVPGTLTLKTDGLHFEVDHLTAAFFYENAPNNEIFIPRNEIFSATTSPSFMGMTYDLLPPRVFINTLKGQVTVTSQWSSKSIATKINDLTRTR